MAGTTPYLIVNEIAVTAAGNGSMTHPGRPTSVAAGWLIWLYFLGLNLFNEQFGQQLGIGHDFQLLSPQLREWIVELKPEVVLASEVERATPRP